MLYTGSKYKKNESIVDSDLNAKREFVFFLPLFNQWCRCDIGQIDQFPVIVTQKYAWQ